MVRDKKYEKVRKREKEREKEREMKIKNTYGELKKSRPS